MRTPKLVVMVSIIFVLAGCSSGASSSPTEGGATTEQTASPTRSSEQSAAPDTSSDPRRYEPSSAEGPAKNVPIPKMPAAAKEKSTDGASAFAEYYFELINYSIETNDSEPLKSTRCGNATSVRPQSLIRRTRLKSAENGRLEGDTT